MITTNIFQVCSFQIFYAKHKMSTRWDSNNLTKLIFEMVLQFFNIIINMPILED